MATISCPNFTPTSHILLVLIVSKRFTDIEDVGQRLIEDNIVSVSRQMIDKEACIPKPSSNSSGAGAGAVVDGAEGAEGNNGTTRNANGTNGHINGQTRKQNGSGGDSATANGRGVSGAGDMEVDEEL